MHRQLKVYRSVKLHENISHSFQVREGMSKWQTCCFQCSKGHNSKNSKARIVDFWTSSHGVFDFFKVSLNYLRWFQSYGAEPTCGAQTDRWIDRPGTKQYPSGGDNHKLILVLTDCHWKGTDIFWSFPNSLKLFHISWSATGYRDPLLGSNSGIIVWNPERQPNWIRKYDYVHFVWG